MLYFSPENKKVVFAWLWLHKGKLLIAVCVIMQQTTTQSACPTFLESLTVVREKGSI